MSKKKKNKNKNKNISSSPIRPSYNQYVTDAIMMMSSLSRIEQRASKNIVNLVLALNEIKNTLNKLEKMAEDEFIKFRDVVSASQSKDSDNVFCKILRGEDISKDIIGNGLTERK